LGAIVESMRAMVGGACTGCLAHTVAPRLAAQFRLAQGASDSAVLFPVRLDTGDRSMRALAGGPRPAFARALARAAVELRGPDVGASYDRVAGDYERAWLRHAAAPIDRLLDQLPVAGARVLDVGCGTGYASVGLAERGASAVVGVDISPGMLEVAAGRAANAGVQDRLRFVTGDFLELAAGWEDGAFDLVVSTWVLGYLPLDPAFVAVARLLAPGGELGLVVHRDRSPRRELALFEELVAREPDVMERRVALDFPRDGRDLQAHLRAAGLATAALREESCTFPCADAQGALEHLLMSGAGTVYYDAVRVSERRRLTGDFVERLEAACHGGPADVVHDYCTAVAVRPVATSSRRGRRPGRS